MKCLPPLLAALLVTAPPATPHGAAPAPAQAPLQAPEVRVHGYRFVVEQVQQQQYEQVEFPPGAQEKAEGKLTGRQHLFLRLAVHPPQPDLLPNIDGLDPKVTALAGTQTVALRGYPVEDSNPLTGGVWRNQLSAQEVELSATHLRGLQGELIVYPKARVVALEFPLGGKIPVTRSADGLQATLRSIQTRTGTLTAAVEIEWPAALSVSRPNPDSPTGVIAVTRAGTSLSPSGSNSRAADKPGWVSRTHSLTFVDVKELPDRIRVEALVRSGAARRIKFQLPEIPLPHTLGFGADPSEADESGPLEPGDPLYSAKGGSILTPLRGAAPGRLVVGLSRVEAGAPGPWRWLAARMGRESGVLTSVRPGRYRIVRAWLPPAEAGDLEPAAAPVQLGGLVEVEVIAGQTATLSPIDARGAR